MKAAKRNNTRLITMDEFLNLPQQPATAVLKADKTGKYGMLCRSSAAGRAPLLLEDVGNRQWGSNCMIDRCYYVQEEQPGGGYRIDFSARADMKDVCSNLEIRLLVYEQNKQVFRELTSASGEETAHLSCGVEWEFAGSEEELEKQIPYAEFSWADKTGEHSVEQKSRFRYRLDELIAKYEHAWPKKESIAQVFDPSKPQPVPVYQDTLEPPAFSENDPGSYVLTALFRAPEDLHDCDYVCYVEKEGGQPHIEIPFLCRLTAAKNWRFRELFPGQSFCMLTGKGSDSGAVRLLAGLNETYTESGFQFQVSEDHRTATVSLVNPWDEHTLRPGDMRKFFYDMDVHLEILMEENGQSGRTETAYLDLNSREDNLASLAEGELRLYPAALMWGCMAADTKIVMADGSRRQIDRIRMGDRVMDPVTGSPVMVVNVWRGMEDRLIQIKTKEGNTLRVTGEHPIYQKGGFIRADHLKAGDILLGECGAQVTVESVETVPYKGYVFNIDLDSRTGSRIMLAEGIAVGDSSVQNGR